MLAGWFTDWLNELPWAGIGAAAAGIGSLLSGIAAYRIARRKPSEPEARSPDR